VLPNMENHKEELIKTAAKICTPGKGILAADENNNIMGSGRFQDIKVENTKSNRRAYRQLLFTTPDIEKYCSGVILYEETTSQRTCGFHDEEGDGMPFVELLRCKGIVAGIQVDKGRVPLVSKQTSTQGLDGLGERCASYYKKGLRFAKWHGYITVEDNIDEVAFYENAHGLARFASICQANGLVPLIEPEVMMEGDHDLSRCQNVTEKFLSVVMKTLHDYHVLLEGTLVKPSMVIPGKSYPHYATTTPHDIAMATVTTLMRTIPPTVQGVLFLSGGQSEIESTRNLNAINNVASSTGKPLWFLSFSFSRALQTSCLKTWSGKKENVKEAQLVFQKMLQNNSLAQLGKFQEA